MNWDKIKIRCSSIGSLMSEPQSKAEKEAGELSKTCKAKLIETYIREKYGREKEDLDTLQIKKGIDVEFESIETLSLYKKKPYEKNEIRIENDWISGIPDLYYGESIYNAEEVDDVKSSYSIWSFLANVPSKLDSDYEWQVTGYQWLTNAKVGAINYILCDMPEHLMMEEKKRLLYKMNVISEMSPEYLLAAEKLERALCYPDIPLEERVLIFPVQRDESKFELIKKRVEKAREFLETFEKNHKNFNQSSLQNILQTIK